MNAQQFLTWMRNPGQTSREESAQLDALLDSFPYFQSGHLLYIKNLHNQGSFLYNNQLKTAAAYAVNRKVLYNMITLKTEVHLEDRRLEVEEKTPTEKNEALETKPEEQISVPPKFPPKKFTKDPDEWEAGMLRQLQLLHHWKTTEGERRESKENSAQIPVNIVQPTEELAKPEEEVAEQKIPDAKEEINTLLYVLVEPGQSEDLPEEPIEETTTEVVSEESDSTQWEITSPVEQPEPAIVVPTDPVQQEILVEAISSTFELEVDDTIPSVAELTPFRLEPLEETPVAKSESPVEEPVVTGMEMSFSQWVQDLNKKTPAELPKTPLSGDKLIEQFIKEEPRLNVKKNGFFNPVNMAKKSVQESDEFITETLARIYAKQGNHFKAIRAYQKLSLKFPEKTAYFAALIDELKRTPNK